MPYVTTAKDGWCTDPRYEGRHWVMIGVLGIPLLPWPRTILELLTRDDQIGRHHGDEGDMVYYQPELDVLQRLVGLSGWQVLQCFEGRFQVGQDEYWIKNRPDYDPAQPPERFSYQVKTASLGVRLPKFPRPRTMRDDFLDWRYGRGRWRTPDPPPALPVQTLPHARYVLPS